MMDAEEAKAISIEHAKTPTQLLLFEVGEKIQVSCTRGYRQTLPFNVPDSIKSEVFGALQNKGYEIAVMTERFGYIQVVVKW